MDLEFLSPHGIAVASYGSVFVADTDRSRVLRVSDHGRIVTFAGEADMHGSEATEVRRLMRSSTGPRVLRSTPPATWLQEPLGIAVDRSGRIVIADRDNYRVRTVDADGHGPYHLASDADGNLYFADAANHAIRVVDREGTIRTVPGTGRPGFRGDGGPASKARLDEPYAVAVDASGSIYITDTGNSRVRRVSPSGTIQTIVP